MDNMLAELDHGDVLPIGEVVPPASSPHIRAVAKRKIIGSLLMLSMVLI
jgi:hypothetical protein